MKETTTWHSERVNEDISLVRWGHFGTPVLLFPTAGGDAQEVERFHLIGALGRLIDRGRIKVYSMDSIAGRAWVSGRHSADYCSWLQNQFFELIRHEIVPAIRSDCRSHDIEILTAGASIGAYNAVATLCRYPDTFRAAIGMSGTYDLESMLKGSFNEEFYFASPIHYLPNLGENHQLEALRRRFVLLCSGEGQWEEPEQSWRMAQVLGAKGIPNRVDSWGPEYDHDWPTWRAMLPHYLEELS